MKLLYDTCHKEEDIALLPNDQVRFTCGNTRELGNTEERIKKGVNANA